MSESTKLDNKKSLADITAKIIFVIGLVASCFHLYVSATGILEAYKMRTTHLMFLLPLAFLIYPMRKKGRFSKIGVIDYIWFVLTLAAMTYISQISYSRLIARIPFVSPLTTLDYVVAVFIVIAVLEATRRVAGMGMVIVCLVAIAYAFFGKYLHGKIRHTGTTVKRMAEQMSLSTNGIFGSTVAASATFIFMFTLFGEFLEYSGAGQFFIDLAFSLTGKARGGPAKMAVIASGLMGMISGSSTANVTSTGVYTIPLMKKTGYRSEFAGAVEASASTGGQIMPPVMGAASFLLAEYVGIPYIKLCAAAAIPAGIKYIFAMLCSKPEITKSPMQNQIAKILLTVSRAPVDIHTARHTSQLHKIPRTNACPKLSCTLACAVLITDAPKRPLPVSQSPVLFISATTSSAPRKFPRYTKTQLRSIPLIRIFRSSTPIIIRQFPVNSSAPQSTTIIRPTGNTAAETKRPTPRLSGSDSRLKDTI